MVSSREIRPENLPRCINCGGRVIWTGEATTFWNHPDPKMKGKEVAMKMMDKPPHRWYCLECHSLNRKCTPTYAVAPCPICESYTLRRKGLVWECETCGFIRMRKWKSDPFGKRVDASNYTKKGLEACREEWREYREKKQSGCEP